MRRVFSDQDGNVLEAKGAGALFPDFVPEGAAHKLDFDPENNKWLNSLLDIEDERPNVKVTSEGVTWRGVEVPVQGISEATTHAIIEEQLIIKLFDDEEQFSGQELLYLMRMFARRLGMVPTKT